MIPAPTPAQQDDLEQLEGFLQALGGGSLVFCLFSSLDDVDYVQKALQDKLDKPLERRTLNAQTPNPLRQLRELPPEPRVVFMVYQGNLEDDLKQTAGYANLQREVLNEINHVLVMWFGEESFARFVRAAPDFWAWHSGGVFEFQGIAGRKPLGETLQATEATLPEQKLVDAEGLQRRAEAYKAIVDSYTDPTPEDLPYLARTLIRYATVLEDLTQHDEALRHAKRAVNIAKNSLKDDALFAEALHLMSVIYAGLGDRETSLEASERSAQVIRKLVEQNPQIFSGNLAVTLDNLGVRYSNLGRYEEGLNIIQEAVDLRRRLAEKNPDAFLSDLAGSLNNLSNRLGELGRYEEALIPIKESVDIYRKLAERDSDVFLHDLAMSLNNLGGTLSQLNRQEEALIPTQEAVEIRRELVKQNPDYFLPDLATSLSNLGIMYSLLDRQEEALPPTQESVEIRRKLSEQNPDVFLPGLAGSLNNWGVLLRILGRLDESLAAHKESLVHLVHVWHQYPRAFNSTLARYFSNYLIAARANNQSVQQIFSTLHGIFGDDLPEVFRNKVLEQPTEPKKPDS